MSLINQVLRDLEKRHAGGGEPGRLQGAVRALSAPPRARGWAPLTAAALALALGGGAVWWLLPRQEATAARPAVPALVARVPAPQSPVLHAEVPAPQAGLPAPQAENAALQVEDQAPQTRASAPQVQPPALPLSQGVASPSAARLESEPVLAGMPARTTPPAPSIAALERKPLESRPPASTRERAVKAQPKPAQRSLVGSSASAEDGESESDAAGRAPEEVVVVEEPGTIERQERWGSIHDRADVEFKRGMRLYQEGRASEAEVVWRGALETDPAHASARHALLGLLLEQGERAQAERLLQDGLRNDPAQHKLGMVLARLQLDRGAQDEALHTLEAGLPHAQQSAEYLTMTAAVMARAGRHREAAALYESALRLGPGNAVWYMGLGLALRADGRHRDALAAFQRARDLKALNPELQAFVERSVRELQ